MKQALVTRGGDVSGRPAGSTAGLRRGGWRGEVESVLDMLAVGPLGLVEGALGPLEMLAGSLEASPALSALTGSLSYKRAQ